MDPVRIAKEHEFSRVQNFYWKLIDAMQASSYHPGWQKGVYPSDEFLMKSLHGSELYVLERDMAIIGAMVLNHECNEGYEDVNWNVDANQKEVMIIHALGVLPEFHGAGKAKAMVREAIRIANEKQQKAIRLDVLGGNVPAIKLYESMGFRFQQSIKMFYEDTGWTDFLLYELPLYLGNEKNLDGSFPK